MADQDQLTPEEIAQVRAILKQRGLDTNLPVQARDTLPSENELGRGRLTLLGRIKRRVLFAWAVGSTILAILTVPTDCLDVQEFYVPKFRAVAEQVAQVIDRLTTDPPSEPPSLPPDHKDTYYAFNAEWRALSDEELQRRAGGTIPLRPDDLPMSYHPITIISSTTNTSQTIISQSGVVRGLG